LGAVDQAGRGGGLPLDSQRVSFDGYTFAQRANSQSDMDGQFIVDVQYDAAFGNLHESSDLGGNGELLAKIATVLARLHATAAACGRLCRNGSIKWRRPLTTGAIAFPVLRWVGLLWTVVWLPTYIRVWGWANLLHLCDIAVILGCVGLWWGSSLLISSQAVSLLGAGIFWSIDIGWRLVTGRFLVGGTEYMWDTRVPLWARLLSSFHISLPLALLWAMRKIGYDRRALALQAAIAGVLLVASRFLPSGFNMNYVYQDPLFHRSWGAAPVHLAVIFVGAFALVYWPTHLLLSWMFPVAATAK